MKVRLVSKTPSPFTIILTTFFFTFRLPQGSGVAEEKGEFHPFRWKIDMWNIDLFVDFTPGDLGMHLEQHPTGFYIQSGYIYRFDIDMEEPSPVPEPIPEPEPNPIPPILSFNYPKMLSFTSTPEVENTNRPQVIFWGTTANDTMEVVWNVPPDWISLAWTDGMLALLDLMAFTIHTGNYDVKYLIRR